MKTWLKIENDVVVCLVRQTETPPDDENGYWIIQPHPLAGPGWSYTNGELTRPNGYTWFVLTKTAFLERFTADELASIRAAAPSNEAVRLCMEHIDGLDKISVQAPRILRAIETLVSNGLLAKDRANSLIEPAKPHEEAPITIPTIDVDGP
jgi:hypothetical protein